MTERKHTGEKKHTGRVSTGEVILRNQTGTKGDYMLLSVPRIVAKDLDHLVGRMFQCELTPEGILYSLLPDKTTPRPAPEWAL